ncbi:hypothetical protein B296_00020891 [Ensete ventricosum]|uniref:Uncharacterized protein n=1 Tax=Ensete ventricosum TaxID=4639 RepID=A0A427AML1_ENSVE|nr:hypothetical protein B296_00020891 [Ensete ventricosum]
MNPWKDMISLLPLQEFMSLTSIQGKLRAYTPCSIFYVDSFYAAWILNQVSSKLLRSSIFIELMIAIMPTIPWVNPSLCPIFTPTLSVPSYDVALDCSPT